MRKTTLRQDNRLTSARYELSLLEKRVLYLIIREIRNQFVLKKEGQRTLFDNLVVSMHSEKIKKELDIKPYQIKEALKQLRLRSFEWQNEYDEEHEKHNWLEVGFINYSKWNDDFKIDVEVSKEILPFFVELSKNFTEYSLVIAISLRSKWSQRFYELSSQWKNAGGFQVKVNELREMLKLENQYSRYASFKQRVLEVARLELKELYDAGQSDLYFSYSEHKLGRSVDSLKFKIISDKDTTKLSTEDIDYIVRGHLHRIFKTSSMPKNMDFVNETMTALRLDVDKLKHCYNRLEKTVLKLDVKEQAKYMRFIINEDYLTK